MEIIFRKKFVKYNQISDVNIVDIHNLLIENGITLELNDEFSNDWAGFSYYYCKSLNELDEKTISSFVYIITWMMTSNAIDIYPNSKSNTFFKNSKIIDECLGIYNELYDKYDSEIDLCKELFDKIYDFYLNNYKKFIKKSERINCVITYQELELLDKVDGNSRNEKLENLLKYYYQ